MSNWTGVGTASTDGNYKLCTLADVNSYLGYTLGDDTNRDTLLNNLIDRATDAIEEYCGRKFKQRTYRLERYDGDGDKLLFLNNYPIYSIDRVATATKTAFSVKCSVDDATFASIDIDSDGVTVTQIGGTNEGSSDILFSNYATISAVVAQINTYTDWTATVATSMGGYVSSDLLDVWGAYCLDQTLDVYTIDTPIYDFLVWREGGREMGILYRNSGWPNGRMNISISYNAGYATIPDDVKQACIETVAAFFNRRKRDTGLSGEKLGDYSWTAAGGNVGYALPQHIRDMLITRKHIPIIG